MITPDNYAGLFLHNTVVYAYVLPAAAASISLYKRSMLNPFCRLSSKYPSFPLPPSPYAACGPPHTTFPPYSHHHHHHRSSSSSSSREGAGIVIRGMLYTRNFGTHKVSLSLSLSQEKLQPDFYASLSSTVCST